MSSWNVGEKSPFEPATIFTNDTIFQRTLAQGIPGLDVPRWYHLYGNTPGARPQEFQFIDTKSLLATLPFEEMREAMMATDCQITFSFPLFEVKAGKGELEITPWSPTAKTILQHLQVLSNDERKLRVFVDLLAGEVPELIAHRDDTRRNDNVDYFAARLAASNTPLDVYHLSGGNPFFPHYKIIPEDGQRTLQPGSTSAQRQLMELFWRAPEFRNSAPCAVCTPGAGTLKDFVKTAIEAERQPGWIAEEHREPLPARLGNMHLKLIFVSQKPDEKLKLSGHWAEFQGDILWDTQPAIHNILSSDEKYKVPQKVVQSIRNNLFDVAEGTMEEYSRRLGKVLNGHSHTLTIGEFAPIASSVSVVELTLAPYAISPREWGWRFVSVGRPEPRTTWIMSPNARIAFDIAHRANPPLRAPIADDGIDPLSRSPGREDMLRVTHKGAKYVAESLVGRTTR